MYEANKVRILALATAAVGISAGHLRAASITWDGDTGGAGTSWNAGVNWVGDALPGSGDEAIFTDAGLTSGKTIALDAPQTIGSLTIASTLGFAIGGAGDTSNALTLTNVTRNSTTEAQTIAAPVALAANSQWTVNGTGVLTVSKTISGAATLTKSGNGELRLNSANSYTGGTVVTEGTLRASVANSLVGPITVGDGTSVASLILGANEAILVSSPAKPLVVKNNGTFDGNNFNNSSGRVSSLTVEAGGKAINTAYLYASTVNVTGHSSITTGNITGSQLVNVATLTSNAADTRALITSSVSWTTFYPYASATVANGTAAIDLEMSGSFSSANSTNAFTKKGLGTLLLSSSAGSSSLSIPVSVDAGALLISNTSGSATGKKAVTVKAGTTFGGNGIIGGLDNTFTDANVTVTGNSSSRAVLSPGLIDTVTGATLVGTLTVGSATQNNNVTLGNYSTLAVDVGDSSTSDLLIVNGILDLTSSLDTLAINQLAGTSLSGSYVLAQFDTLNGEFDAVIYNGASLPAGWSLSYTGTPGGGNTLTNGQILLSIPEPASLALLGMGGIALLTRSSNRRRAKR